MMSRSKRISTMIIGKRKFTIFEKIMLVALFIPFTSFFALVYLGIFLLQGNSIYLWFNKFYIWGRLLKDPQICTFSFTPNELRQAVLEEKWLRLYFRNSNNKDVRLDVFTHKDIQDIIDLFLSKGIRVELTPEMRAKGYEAPVYQDASAQTSRHSEIKSNDKTELDVGGSHRRRRIVQDDKREISLNENNTQKTSIKHKRRLEL